MRDVMAWHYTGRSYVETAELQGVSTQCIEQHHRLAMERWPVLCSRFPE